VNLDLRSLTAMAGMMGAVMGIVLLGLRRNYPATIKGLLPWGLAPLVCAASTLFYGLDGLLPEALVALGGNALLLSGCGLFYVGSQRFYGRASNWPLWLGIGIIGLLVLSWFLLVQPDYRIRVLIFTGIMAAMVVAHTRLLWQQGRGFAPRFTAAVLAVQAAVLLGRALSSLYVDTPDTARFAPSPLQTAYIAVYSFSVLLLGIGVLLMASERLRAEFEHIATHDGLTGALTRRALLAAGEQELARWQRYGRPLSLLLLDIDHFKRINDGQGHLAGDRVLIDVVAVLGQTLRHADRLGRYGGEEFIMLLPETEAPAALLVAERMREAVARGGACTASIGVSSLQAGDRDLDALLARADAALYRAKAQGRNRVEPG